MSSIRLPSLEGLQAFEACARLGSFDRAAEELDITTSAVSKRISGVEELVGAELFFRSSRKLILTPVGNEYLDDVRTALAQLANVALHQRKGPRNNRLRVVAPPAFARHVLTPNLAQYLQANADVELEVLTTVPYLIGEPPPCDLQIRFDVPTASSAKLLFEPVYPMAAPTYLRGLGEMKIPTDIGRGLLLRCPLEPWQPWFAAARITLPEPSRGPKLVDVGMALEAAAHGLGLVLGRRSIAMPWLDRGELVPAFPLRAHSARGYCLEVRNPTRVATQFAGWLQGVCAALEREALQPMG